jgi:hypothetical protein
LVNVQQLSGFAGAVAEMAVVEQQNPVASVCELLGVRVET